jgi:hypothetical protein
MVRYQKSRPKLFLSALYISFPSHLSLKIFFLNHSIRTVMAFYSTFTYSAIDDEDDDDYDPRPRPPPTLPLQLIEQYYTCTITTQPYAPRIKNIAIRIYIPSTAALTPTSGGHTLTLLRAFNGRLCPHTHTRGIMSIKSLHSRSLCRKIWEMFTPDQGDTLTTACHFWRCGAR